MITRTLDAVIPHCLYTDKIIRQTGAALCLLVITPLLLLAQPARAEIPKECYDLYVETGARPLGPNTRSIVLLTRCNAVAATASTDLGTYYCTSSSGMAYID
jgi:hypothetical protein